MRKEFSAWAEEHGRTDAKLVFLTGDLGFMALEPVRLAMGRRFINVGVCEQNMVSMAAALASEGLRTICYSIAPFVVYRPNEQIRLDVCLHHLPVKIVGNGGGYGYGIMGATHHALEDLAVLSGFSGMKCFVPYSNLSVAETCDAMMGYEGPSYLRLGFGSLPDWVAKPASYRPIQKLVTGDFCTVVGIGPVILNALTAVRSLGVSSDVFAVAEFPLTELSQELTDSIRTTGRLLVVEEHVEQGGLGSWLALRLCGRGLAPRMIHRFARGYPSGRYGSQSYHQKQSGLDAESLGGALKELAEMSVADDFS